ncbi:MAG: cysteine synthase family protein [Longimicrobiales bacterium]|nr:cysteine synthase family protein [Longimicrobiales bacterium]
MSETQTRRTSQRAQEGSEAGATRPPELLRSVEESVGNTPLIQLRRVADPEKASVFVKLEGMNPGGSVKDRAAREIIRRAVADGDLGPGRTLLDASSGNTGIAYAMICASRGYGCEICLPGNASEERKELLAAYGATVVETDREEGSDGAIREARRRAEEDPDRYFYADQYNNPGNWQAHLKTTAPEIWRQTEGTITHFVAILGTSGTLMGTGRGLLERNPDIRVVAAQPDSPFHGIEGAKHMETALVPGIYDPELAHENLAIRTEEAQAMALRLAREEGLFTGVSGGANVVAALQVAEEAGPDAVIVTVLCDGGERYLSESWVKNA